jgi:drug/metabolite transporter (DMT)-like permease
MVEFIGFILAIDAIISWSIASLVYKTGLKNTEPKATVLFRLVLVSFFTLMFALIFGNIAYISDINQNELSFYFILCMASGLFVTVGDLMYFISLQKIDASRAFPLTQLSLVFVYPFAFIFFGEELTLPIIIGGILILSSVFFLSSKDKKDINKGEKKEEVLIGVILGIATALLWALSMVTFHQARIISNDVFFTNFYRMFFATITIALVGIFKREYYGGYKKENRDNFKYYFYIGIAGSLSLGLADSLFYKAAEMNGLVLTSTITANTPMVQQILSVLILKEKLRKKFFIAVALIILGNYLILFL